MYPNRTRRGGAGRWKVPVRGHRLRLALASDSSRPLKPEGRLERFRAERAERTWRVLRRIEGLSGVPLDVLSLPGFLSLVEVRRGRGAIIGNSEKNVAGHNALSNRGGRS